MLSAYLDKQRLRVYLNNFLDVLEVFSLEQTFLGRDAVTQFLGVAARALSDQTVSPFLALLPALGTASSQTFKA